MNQILITQKLYVTPELKRKKKLYKLCFIISTILLIVLLYQYIAVEYDRNKENIMAQEMIEGLLLEGDTTIIDQENNALIVAMTQEQIQEQIIEENISTNEALVEEDKNTIISGEYTDADGNSYSIIGMINIPKIDVKYPIISETSTALMKISVCKFWGPNANEVGNLCIVGHNYRNSKFFSKVPSLTCGDVIEITDLEGETVKYEVYDIYTVDPSDTRCTTQLTQGKREITIITCTNNGKQRVVVKCTEKL